MCFNHLLIAGLPAVLKDFESRAVGGPPTYLPADPEPEPKSILSFHSLLPVPDTLLTDPLTNGAEAWMWEHWGCTGYRYDDVRLERLDGSLLYHFETHVMPPINWVSAVSEIFATLTFTLSYIKSLNDRGVFQVANGVVNEAGEWPHDETNAEPADAARQLRRSLGFAD